VPLTSIRKRIHVRRSDPQDIQEALQKLTETKSVLKRVRCPSHYPFIPPFGKSAHSSTCPSPGSLAACKKNLVLLLNSTAGKGTPHRHPLFHRSLSVTAHICGQLLFLSGNPPLLMLKVGLWPVAPASAPQGGSTALGLPARGCPT
jgi:hypothetical protein